MDSPNINYIWSDILIEELVRNGITRFVISSGSRNSPLVIAAAKNPKCETIVHTDERGAAFYALGYAKSSGKPPVLIATSGTANANYYPAVIEASQSALPMILLTADRPIELRDTGAPQTMNQVALYGKYVRWSFDFPAPSMEIEPQFVLTTVDQAVYRSLRAPSGPVHLNCQFREPLAPLATEDNLSDYTTSLAQWQSDDKPHTKYLTPTVRTTKGEIDEIAAKISSSKNGLMVAGPMHAFSQKDHILAVAEKLGIPLLADVGSGLRFDKQASNNILTHYDYILRTPEFLDKFKPDLVIHLGGLPVSNMLNTFLKNSNPKYIYVNDTPFRQDSFHQVNLRVEMDPNTFCKMLIEKEIKANSQLLQLVKNADLIAQQALEKIYEENKTQNELAVARYVIQNLPENHNLFVGNSMPIRDADGTGLKRDVSIHVGVNRSVNGIDGIIASAVGFAAGNKKSTTLLLGDLSMLHDLNSLLLVRNSKTPIFLVVLNNNGSAIFSYLPIAQDNDYFEEFFATPNNITFEHAARQFDLDYFHPTSIAEFEQAFLKSIISDKSTIIEVQTDREASFQNHKKTWEQVSASIIASIHG